MPTHITQQAFDAYMQQSQERLDDFDGEAFEDRLRRVYTEYCRIPHIAQDEIDAVMKLLPRHSAPALNAMYAWLPLLRTRALLQNLVFPHHTDTMTEWVTPDDREAWQQESPHSNALLDADIRRSAHDLFDPLEMALDGTIDLRTLEDADTCQPIATRRLSQGIIDACTGSMLNNYNTLLGGDFPRLQPLLDAQRISIDDIRGVTHGICSDTCMFIAGEAY